MKLRTWVQKGSQMGRNRAFSLLEQEEVAMATDDYSEHQKVATWSLWRQKVAKMNQVGRHLGSP